MNNNAKWTPIATLEAQLAQADSEGKEELAAKIEDQLNAARERRSASPADQMRNAIIAYDDAYQGTFVQTVAPAIAGVILEEAGEEITQRIAERLDEMLFDGGALLRR